VDGKSRQRLVDFAGRSFAAGSDAARRGLGLLPVASQAIRRNAPCYLGVFVGGARRFADFGRFCAEGSDSG
jgi:hypothetical protein